VRNEKIINNSVARLRPHHAAALLEGAVERLRTRARRGTELTVWIKAVLTHHTAYLMAAPGALPILATLSQVKHDKRETDWQSKSGSCEALVL
jgi:U3 small nucleolar RNA-associated protein 5